MSWIYLAIAAVLTAELVFLLPLQPALAEIAATALKVRRVIGSRAISDHWKELVLPAYAFRIGFASIRSFGWLVLAFFPFVLLGLFWPGGLDALGAVLLDWRTIVGLSVLSAGYAWVRTIRGRRAQSLPAQSGSENYGPAEKVLHRLALGVPVIPEMVHDIERATHLKGAPAAAGGAHVFVAGLARAGTTMLLRELHDTGRFATLTYADMPFVLAPNLWAQMAGTRNAGDRHERAHGDGIMVDAESPEAFDEVYWRVMDGDAYIRPDRLLPHRPNGEIVRGFTDYMSLILKRCGKTRYLSKNNNNILRLPTLVAAYPEAAFLVPIRRPLQHAASLLRQHRRFSSSDAFTNDYMHWLGHHEFGRNHRPFDFSGDPKGDPETLDYWLRAWIGAHIAILEIDAPNLHVVELGSVATSPAARDRLATLLGLPGLEFKDLRVVAPTAVPDHDLGLATQANSIFATLQARAVWTESP